MPAHRLAYELLIGPVPDGRVLDHLCRNPGCVNPAHLEVVSQRENQRRGLKGELTTHCPQGHAYDDGNTYQYTDRQGGNHRMCRQCRRERNARRQFLRAKKRGGPGYRS